jgi:hypothetical protein
MYLNVKERQETLRLNPIKQYLNGQLSSIVNTIKRIKRRIFNAGISNKST